jgi:hypothetical protein
MHCVLKVLLPLSEQIPLSITAETREPQENIFNNPSRVLAVSSREPRAKTCRLTLPDLRFTISVFIFLGPGNCDLTIILHPALLHRPQKIIVFIFGYYNSRINNFCIKFSL